MLKCLKCKFFNMPLTAYIFSEELKITDLWKVQAGNSLFSTELMEMCVRHFNTLSPKSDGGPQEHLPLKAFGIHILLPFQVQSNGDLHSSVPTPGDPRPEDKRCPSTIPSLIRNRITNLQSYFLSHRHLLHQHPACLVGFPIPVALEHG